MDLLAEVKNYLNITWDDPDTDNRLIGFLERGKARLQKIAGVQLDFDANDFPRTLLLDYARYANSQALEMFEINFASELLGLNLDYGVLPDEDQPPDGL